MEKQTATATDVEDLIRRGPWTVEEDFALINHIAYHGEGRWNSLAISAGLKRTGKSCRLRWLNYLRPDVRRGNITLEEQLLILELHSRWGNRWSKIAQQLPGRTDNEIKNYWRTRVQKHAKQLKCDVNSKQFKDTMRYLWMPRLVERIQAADAGVPTSATYNYQLSNNTTMCAQQTNIEVIMPENCSAAASSAIVNQAQAPEQENYNNNNKYCYSSIKNQQHRHPYGDHQSLSSPTGAYFEDQLQGTLDFMDQNSSWMDGGDHSLWNVDDVWF